MATTITTLNSGFTLPAALTLNVLDVSAFALVDTKILADGVSRESVYQLLTGNDEFPMSFRVGVYRNPKANGGIGNTNVSVKLMNYAEKADIDDVVWTEAETWTLSKGAPGSTPFYDTDVDIESIGALLSIFLNVVAGVVTTTNLDEFKVGVTNRVTEHANSAA